MQRRPRCERTPEKIKYLDEAGALLGIERRMARLGGAPTYPYECLGHDGCGYWHATSDPARRPSRHTPERGVGSELVTERDAPDADGSETGASTPRMRTEGPNREGPLWHVE